MTAIPRLRTCLLVGACLATASCGDADIQTVEWQLDGNGYVQFLTNDPLWYGLAYLNTYTQLAEPTMTTVTAVVKKQAGSHYAGYGMVFCYHDSDNFYLLLIDAASQYSAQAKVQGEWRNIVSWTRSPTMNLKSGLGVDNRLSIAQESPGHFSLALNDVTETAFDDASFSGGMAGFYVGIGEKKDENFPQTPEDVRLKMILPASYP